MTSLGFKKINIPECFLGRGILSGLSFEGQVGIPQRLCVYPAENADIDYRQIRPSLLLSDVF